jgi:beta-N-acetylhexosaminidase
MPPNAEVAIKAVVAAVREGKLSEKRINESAMRVLAAKARVGLQKSKLVNLEEISEVIESAESEAHAQNTAERAVTLVKNEGNLLPLSNPAGACMWVLTESRYGVQGRRFAEEMRTRTPGVRLQLFDSLVPLVEMEESLKKAGTCESHVVAAFASVAAYRGNVALGGEYPAFMEMLKGTGAPIVLVSLGNPYLLQNYPHVASYLATFSPVIPSEAAAAKAILGNIDISGKLPVTIPGLAKIGDSILLPKK